MPVDLIRHTRPEVAKGTCYGQTDLPLAADFPQALSTLRKHLADPYQQVFSSPLRRCQQLAQALPSQTPYQCDPRLLELNFGHWEGQSWHELGEQRTKAWAEDFVNVAPEGGESFAELQARVADFWQHLLTLPTTDKVAVVTHAGVIRASLALLMDIPPTRVFQLELNYGCALRVELRQPFSHSRLRFLAA